MMFTQADDEELLALRARVAELQSSVQVLQLERDAAHKQAEHATKQAEHAAQEVKSAHAVAEHLRLRIKRLAYLLYGRRSEKLSAEELGQLLLSFGGSDDGARSADPSVPTPTTPQESVDSSVGVAPTGTSKKKRKSKHRGRTELSPTIERIVTPVLVPEGERACKCCGLPMVAIKPLEHQRVEYVPDKLVAHIEQREVLVCKSSACRGDAI